MNLLHLDSAISSRESITRSLTALIVDQLAKKHPFLEVTYRDLIVDPVPYMNLKTLPGSHGSAAPFDGLLEPERADRAMTERTLEELLAADIVVVGVPMYNFGIAAQLKSWFDAIIIPQKTFTYTSNGAVGLMGSKHVLAVVARGATYGANGFPASMEHAEMYIRSVFSFLGVSNLDLFLAEGAATNRDGALDKARDSIRIMLDSGMDESS